MPKGTKHSKTAVILIADAGAGHRKPALALKESLDSLYPHLRTQIFNVSVDPYPPSSKLSDNAQKHDPSFIERVYHFFNAYWTNLYTIGYYLSNNPLVMRVLEWFLSDIKRHIVAILLEENPDIVVSMFPIIHGNLNQALQTTKQNPFTAVVVTDTVSVHLSWFYQKNFDLYIVGSSTAERRLLNFGIPKKHIEIHHPCLSSQFKGVPSEEQIVQYKQELDLPQAQPIVLFAGGGEGFKKIPSYLSFILKNKLFEDHHYILVVGRNRAQYRCLEHLIAPHAASFSLYSFTDKMFELMACSDLIFSKAGTSTTYQALVLQKPLFFTHIIGGQETGTKDLVHQLGVGDYFPTRARFQRFLTSYRHNKALLTPYKQALFQLNMQNGSAATAYTIFEGFQRKKSPHSYQ